MPKLLRVPEAHVEYAYGIYLLNNKHRLIKTMRKRYQPSIHGHKAWGAGFLLMDYLQHNGLVKGAKAMEIGCGWGGVSVFCARTFKARMTAVDLDPAVFPYVDVLAELNGVAVEPRQADLSKLKGKELGQHRYILGSDICFWDSLVKPLTRLVNRAIDNGTRKVIITDPGRPTFYELCDALSKRHKTRLQEWYASEPERFEGEVLEVRPK
ncbi:MAG: methyltransferase domain-containing protein [Pseudomonadota bacterium]